MLKGSCLFVLLCLSIDINVVHSFMASPTQRIIPTVFSQQRIINKIDKNRNPQRNVQLWMGSDDSNEKNDADRVKFKAAQLEESIIEIKSEKSQEETKEDTGAKVNTVNERLLQELQEAQDKEKYGSKSKLGKKFQFRYSPEKTDEERLAALEEARNLNGINPWICIGGSLFAAAVSAGLWFATGYLGEVFATHPVTSDFYTIQRLASVFRNAVIGIVSLASGFFGVTGLGIFLLGLRVAQGVLTGELDPTPIVNKNKDDPQILNIWGFMTGSNKRRSKDGKKRDNPFL